MASSDASDASDAADADALDGRNDHGRRDGASPTGQQRAAEERERASERTFQAMFSTHTNRTRFVLGQRWLGPNAPKRLVATPPLDHIRDYFGEKVWAHLRVRVRVRVKGSTHELPRRKGVGSP